MLWHVVYTPDIYEDAGGYLKKANDQNRWMCSFYLKMMLIAVLSIPLLLAVISYILCIWKYDEFDYEHVFHLFKAV